MIQPTHLSSAQITENKDSGAWQNNLLQNYLRAMAGTDPQKPAVTDGARTWTYGEIDALIEKLAHGMRSLGIKAGDVVAWQLPNWVESLAIHHAAIRIGAISNPIIPIYRQREVAFILKQAKAKAIFVPAVFRGFDYLKMIDDIRDGLPYLRNIVAVRGEIEAHSGELKFEDLLLNESKDSDIIADPAHSPYNIALLLYTSGTTSDPKGVLHSHNTLDYENRSIIKQFGLTNRDVVFMPSPVGHITGILYGLHLPFMLGSHVVFQDVWNPDVALRLIGAHHCSLMIAATPFLHGIVYHPDTSATDLSSMRVVACGGADVPPELISATERTLNCFATRIYGSSEFPTLSSCDSSDPSEKRATTDGRPIGFARARLGDQDDTGAGELLVRGPELFAGYLDATLNADAFDADGWFHTGDLATIDAQGYVTIVGRLKDIIIRGGENISAKEVEDLLFEHPAVGDVAIVGMPDPVLVERSCAYVVPRSHNIPSLEDLNDFLEAKQLAKQKLPERLEIVTELPRTASGKVQKFKLRHDIRAKLSERPDF